MSIKALQRTAILAGAGSLMAFSGALPALAGDGDSSARLWTHTFDGWTPESVGLGDQAGQVFLARGGESDRARLLSAFADDNGGPVWEADANAGYSIRHQVASASDADRHANLRIGRAHSTAPYRVTVESYSSSNSTSAWEFEFPFDVYSSTEAGIEISRDGSLTVAWVDRGITVGTQVAVWRDAGSQPDEYELVTLYSAPWGVELSADASTLYISGKSVTTVVTPNPWVVLHEEVQVDPLEHGHALSGDGSVFAHGLNNGSVNIYGRASGDYELEHTHWSSLGASARVSRLALSADGRWLACGFDVRPDFLEVRIQVIDLEHPTHAVVFEDVLVGAGSYDNVVRSLQLSDNGEVLAAGLWGDEAGLTDELHVYRRTGSTWSVELSEALVGSVLDLDLAPDGDHLAVGYKSDHANILTSDGFVSFYRIGGADLCVNGVPSIGSTVTLEHSLPTGEMSRALWANSPQDPAMTFPGVGTLYIARGDVHVLGNSMSNGQGVATMEYSIPNDPSLVGQTVYFQGLQAAPRRLSGDWVKLTILP